MGSRERTWRHEVEDMGVKTRARGEGESMGVRAWGRESGHGDMGARA